MAIYLCGDAHGLLDLQKVEDFFGLYAPGDECSRADYLIILGDAGILWDGGEQDRRVQQILSRLPVTVLWLDGNHENFDLLSVYPEDRWHGGRVHFIDEHIIHLMRGQVFEIDGTRIFTFGGGNSIDKHLRRPGLEWWPEEMPSEEEYEEGLRNLERAGNEVDYVLTHTCPYEVAMELARGLLYPGEEVLQQYLQGIADHVAFQGWYFGHWHKDEQIDSFTCLYNEIVELQ